MKNKGITLIALVITIVVLIILAAVAINLSLGSNGIFNRAKTAKEKYSNAQEYEKTKISKTTNEVDSMISGNRNSYEERMSAMEARITALEEENATLRAKITPVLLFSGEAGTGDNITLNDSMFNYNYLIITMGNSQCMMKVRHNQDGSYWYQAGSINAAQASDNINCMGVSFNKISNDGKTLTVQRCGYTAVTKTANSHTHPWNAVTISSIYGLL